MEKGVPIRANGYSYSKTYYFVISTLAYDCCGVVVCNTKALVTIDNTHKLSLIKYIVNGARLAPPLEKWRTLLQETPYKTDKMTQPGS